MIPTPIILVGLLALGGLAIMGAGLASGRTQRDLNRRVDQVFRAHHGQRPAAYGPEQTAGNASRGARLLHALLATGVRPPWRVEMQVVQSLLFGFGAFAVTFLALRGALHLPAWLAALIALGAFVALPRLLLRQKQHRAVAHFLTLLPDAVDMVVRMVRAGLPVTAAIRAVARETAPPLNAVFAVIADDIDVGIPLEVALSSTADRIALADFHFFAMSVSLQRATGGNLATTLESLSEIIRKRRAVRMKARAATAEVRMSALVLGAIPFFVVGALAVTSPDYLLPLIVDRRGNVILGVALVCLTLAALSMQFLIRRTTSA